MNSIEMNLTEFTKTFGRHRSSHVIVYLWTQYRVWKDEDKLITHLTKTIAHEELHIILRRFGIPYTINEEQVFKRLQIFLYPELYNKKEKAQEIKDELWINHSVIADIEEYIN